MANGRAIVSAAFYVNKAKDDIFFTEQTELALDGDEPAAGLAAAARASSTLVPGAQLPGGLHLPELRQDDAEGLRARREHDDQPATSACS